MNLIKKFFNWTPRDVAAWESIRAGGLRRFVIGYGLLGFGGIMFLLLGGAVFIFWLKAFLQDRMANTGAQLGFLALELVFVAALCLVGGLITSWVTWIMEEKIYQRYKTHIR